MSFVLWTAAAWLGISVATAFAVAAFIRHNRRAPAPVPVRALVTPPLRAARLR